MENAGPTREELLRGLNKADGTARGSIINLTLYGTACVILLILGFANIAEGSTEGFLFLSLALSFIAIGISAIPATKEAQAAKKVAQQRLADFDAKEQSPANYEAELENASR